MRSELPLDLDDGLRLRLANPSDADALGDFNHRLHDDHEDHDIVGRFIRHAASGGHPTHTAEDYTIVEKADTGEIVSSCCLISQTWTFGGAPFKVGQPEFVATLESYRRRGLVRRQFDLLHEMSAARGELMQVITGIPWYYSQFGYEMAMNLGGGRAISVKDIPEPLDAPRCRFREMRPFDEAFARELCERGSARQPFAVQRADELWAYAFRSGRARGIGAKEWLVIERPSGERIGCVAHDAWHEGDKFCVFHLELVPGVGYIDLTPSLLAGLWKRAQAALATGIHPTETFETIYLNFGAEHPAYQSLNDSSADNSYAFFVRVPDLIAYLNAVRPGLERNLVGSAAEGYTGELTVGFYRTGFRMKLEAGRIIEIAEASSDRRPRFPYPLFLHLMCGRRRTRELTDFFADCSASDEAAALLDALFPPFTGVLLTLM